MRTTSRILTNLRKIVLQPVSLIYRPSKSPSSAVRFRRFYSQFLSILSFSDALDSQILCFEAEYETSYPGVIYPISAGLRILSPTRLPGCSLPNYAQSIRCIKAESISGVERASFYNLSQRVGHSDIPLGVFPYFRFPWCRRRQGASHNQGFRGPSCQLYLPRYWGKIAKELMTTSLPIGRAACGTLKISGGPHPFTSSPHSNWRLSSMCS
jgi:hypothetical protein